MLDELSLFLLPWLRNVLVCPRSWHLQLCGLPISLHVVWRGHVAEYSGCAPLQLLTVPVVLPRGCR